MAVPSQHQSVLSAAIRTVAGSRSPACILDARGAFLFVNEAWQQVPPDAGGPAPGAPLVGTPFVEAFPPALRALYARAVADALAARGALPRVVASEWNDATTARLVSTRIDPLVARGGVLGVVVQRSVVRERPIAEVYPPEDRGDPAYRDAGGALAQCACCRRVRDLADRSRWDFVPRLAGQPAELAVEVCELCAELHLGA